MPFLFDWDTFSSPNGSTTIVDGNQSTVFTSTGVNSGPGAPNPQYFPNFGGSILSGGADPGETGGVVMTFTRPVVDATFEIIDLDAQAGAWDDEVSVFAFDADGNAVPVIFSNLESYHVRVDANTVEANGNSSRFVDGPGARDSITVSFGGPVARIEVNFGAGSSGVAQGLTGLGAVSGTVVCFARDMRITTETGDIPVQTLKVGDRVHTMDHGLQEIRWIGSRKVAAQGALAPIVIDKGALGNDAPLIASPQHRILFTGWQAELMFGEAEILVAAKHLTGMDRIYAREGGEVEYFHILFDTHEIVFAEGVPSESYHPGACGLDSMDDAQRAEIFRLFPALMADPAAFGPAARCALSRSEGRVFVNQLRN
ncbi:Hint domain-containing protein [Yoonia sp. SS1-5]|uniref:Hint domain-containing protein n=1 Tax=Yoonia rhodophyticola TaxID=3137370 RepID=A0AAN0MFH8_9RHOB